MTLDGPLIDPDVVAHWLRATIGHASNGVDAWLDGNGYDTSVYGIGSGDDVRIFPRGRGPASDEVEGDQWPCVVFKEVNGGFDTAGDKPLAYEGSFLITYAQCAQALPAGYSLEGFCRVGMLALQAVLNGVSVPTVATGSVHSCAVVEPFGPFIIGPDGQETCERGYIVRLLAT